jgi:hypothetical protein
LDNRQRAELVYDAVLKDLMLSRQEKQSIEHQGKGALDGAKLGASEGGAKLSTDGKLLWSNLLRLWLPLRTLICLDR